MSIEAQWAAELFDTELARGMLFPRQTALSMQRENVYYRSPAASGGLAAPGRIIWYVKASPGSQNGIRAVSTLRDVVVGDPAQLYRRFAHLGTYTNEQVLETARAGAVMALRFSHTSLFPSPVALQRYRHLMSVNGVGLNLQGPQRLPDAVADALLATA